MPQQSSQHGAGPVRRRRTCPSRYDRPPMMLLPLCLLSALLAPQDDDTAPEPASAAPHTEALHLSSMTSMRAARLNADGSVDSGLGVLQLLDGETGQPLVVEHLRYGPMPDLWASFTTKMQ